MEELIPWDQLADRQVLQANAHETVESVRRRLAGLGGHAQYNAPILVGLANGQVAPTSAPALRRLAQQRGAPLLRLRLESLLPELCPEPWAVEGEAEAVAAARRRGLPVIASRGGVPVALALPPPRLVAMVAPDADMFDLFDEPLTPAAMAGVRFVVVAPASNVAQVAATLGPGPERDTTFVLLQVGSTFQVVDRRLEQEAPNFGAQIWPRTLAELRPRLWPAKARPYRELGLRQAEAIAGHTFLVLLDEQGLAAGMMPPPAHLAGRALPGDKDNDLFDLPLALPRVDLEHVALPDAPFVLATPGTPVARVAADLKTLTGDEARRAYVLVETGARAYGVVGTWELNDALSGAGPAPWGLPLGQVVPDPHPAQVRAVEDVGSRQVRNWTQNTEPLVLLRQRRPWRLLPGALRPTVRRGTGSDLFTVARQVLEPYLAPQQGTLEALLPKSPREPGEAALESWATTEGEPQPRVVNFWFATPEGQALAHQRPLELGRGYQLRVNLGRRRVESVTAAGSPAIREPAPETVEGTPLHVCLFSDDFEVPQPTRSLLLPPEGDSPIVTFAVTPLRASQAEGDPATIEIAVYYRCNLVQAWQARVEVVRAGGAARGPQPQQGLLLAARDRDYLLPEGLGGRRLSLLVDHAPGGYRFDLVLAAAGEEGEVRLPWRARLRREDLVHLVTKARRQLTNIARSRPYQAAVAVDEPARRKALQALALLGRQLYLKLFEGAGPGGDVAEWIRREAGEGAVFQVVHRARDFVFPWGLVYDRPLWDDDAESLEVALDGFWGYRYEIELLTEELFQVQAAAGLEIGLGDRLRVGVGLNDRLASAREQRQLFAGLAAESGDRVEYALLDRGPAWLRLLREGRHELLYLFCHGFTERMATDLDLSDDLLGEFRAYLGSLPAEKRAELQDQEETLFDVSDSWLKLTYGQVPLTMLHDCAPPRLEAAPLVLLNMCESAQVLPSLSGGFVPFFLERGARGVIGTECPMTSTFAHAFAREFFPRFLQGQPVGRILWELRRTFLEMGNPLGLAYTLYCDAGTKLAVPVL